jgi:hypothetical protein
MYRERCPEALGKQSTCGMRYGPAGLGAAGNRARNGRPVNVAKAGRPGGIGGAIGERKRGPGAGSLGDREDRRLKAAIYLKMTGANLLRIHHFRPACERIRRRI